MSKKWVISLLIFLIFFNDISYVSASPPARIVAGIVTNVVSTVFKWLWSLRTPVIKPEKAVASRSLMKFEAGYTVETVFDGSKVGIEPYSVQASPTGELLMLDSVNNNLYKISTPLSRYSRPKIIAGSPEGYTGHVDGKLRDARMYGPKGLTVDDSGNIYIADTMNMAIRKITDAGGKWSHGGSHMDGASEDAKFSDDFDLVYVRSSCSLLVTDRGNQAIREIQLHEADCSYEQPPIQHDQQTEENLYFGIAKTDPRMQINSHAIAAPYQRPPKSVRPPLIPPEDEYGEEEEGLLFSFGRLIINASSSVAEVFAGLLFSGFRKRKTRHHDHLRHFQQLNRHPDHSWPMQTSYGDEPPGLENVETRTSIMRKPYPQQQLRQGQAGEKGSDKSEIVFGAVQEQDGRREAMVIKAVDYSDPVYNHQNVRPRLNYMGYSSYSYS
uniref:NHL repeat-containing protein n=1 Tax=Chenopodium quinoa TaxID=63459 RepID=A0A803MVL6_CHEQI